MKGLNGNKVSHRTQVFLVLSFLLDIRGVSLFFRIVSNNSLLRTLSITIFKKALESHALFLHLNISINISYRSSYISNSPDKGNVMNTKEFLYLVIIFLNIMTFMANSAGKPQEGMKCPG